MLRTVGLLALLALVPLLFWYALPDAFPSRAHGPLAALPLALAALVGLIPAVRGGRTRAEWAKAVVLAAAFLFWAANQLVPEGTLATVLNDVAVALFVVDVFLAIPSPSRESGLTSSTRSHPIAR
jgi:integral membrane sensor domain MASE1